MNGLVALVLGTLLGVGLAAGDLGRALEAQLRDEVTSARRIAVEVDPGAASRLGQLEQVAVLIDQADARELPLAALVPLAEPRTAKGRIGSIELRATRVWLDTFRASEVLFHAEEVRFSLLQALRGRLRVTSLGEQRLTVTFRDGDLDEHAAYAFPGLLEPRITFEAGQFVFRSQVPAFLAAFPATVSGRLAIDEGRRLVLREAVIETGRLELTDQMRAEVLAALDPLLDLDQVLPFPVPLVWDEIAVGDGEAVLVGRIEAPERIEVRREFQPRWFAG